MREKEREREREREKERERERERINISILFDNSFSKEASETQKNLTSTRQRVHQIRSSGGDTAGHRRAGTKQWGVEATR